MSELEAKMVDLLDKVEVIASEYTPEIINSASESIRISAIGELLYSIIALISTYVLFRCGKTLCLFFIKKKDEDGFYSEWEVGYAISSVVTCIACVILITTSIYCLFDIWNWVALYNPKLAMIHKVLGL